MADEPDRDETAEQIARFESVRDALAAAGVVPEMLHAANSAGALAHAGSRYDMVRAGIALYGLAPSPALGHAAELRPVLSLHARVTHVKQLEAGERVSYGLRYQLGERSTIATLPLGYADGVTRALAAAGAEVLVRGRRRPVAGTITMDQLLVDCGSEPVALGEEVVLLGSQGDQTVTADEWAERLGTISYEVVCGIGPRVPRIYTGAAASDAVPDAQPAVQGRLL